MTESSTLGWDVGRAPIKRCPACSGSRFRAETGTYGVAFRCTTCGVAWRVELGHLSAFVDDVPFEPASQ